MADTRALLDAVNQLRDEELLAGLARLLREDRALTVQLLVHIGEVDVRTLYREQAHASRSRNKWVVSAPHADESDSSLRAARCADAFSRFLELAT